MKRYINIHCHLINFHFIPDAFFKIRAPIREQLLKRCWTRWIAKLITLLIPGKKYNRLHELLSIFKKEINEVAGILIKEMEESGIEMAIPLMMDLEYSSYHKKPEVPYRHQIELISRIAFQYPGKIMPFVMVDPRRVGAAKITIRALEELAFLGIKMYPPLGYHPYHKSFYNDDHVNTELKEIYRYCEKHKIPITAHCSKGGAYSSDIMNYPELRSELTKPSNWREVLKEFPDLYLNLAHFGGDFLNIKNNTAWSFTIKQMIQKFNNVYADLAYNDHALGKKTSKNYFLLLNEILSEDSKVQNKILFGTDWSMTRHTWTEKEYLNHFIDGLDGNLMNQLAIINPMSFLFPSNEIPERIADVFSINNKRIPNWMYKYFSSDKSAFGSSLKV